MLNLNSILVFSENPQKLADFYQQIFQKNPEMNEGGYVGFLVGNGFITFGPHDKVRGTNPNPERIMFNFETEAVKEEFDRIRSLGARVVAEPYNSMDDPDTWIATLADPDGNIFQLITPWKENT